MTFRKAEKEDFYKIRSLYWNLIDQEQDVIRHFRIGRKVFIPLMR